MSDHQKHQYLAASQVNALEHIRKLSSANSKAPSYIRGLLRKYGISAELYRAAMEKLQTGTRTAVHFHPDRLTRSGRKVVSGMLESGRYLSQFETGISSGSPTAFEGGERDTWELNMFGGAYHSSGATIYERPKYGALQVFPYPDGPSPRFGSCYFLLSGKTLSRSTFTFGGSQEPDAVTQSGTIDKFHPVLAAILKTIEDTGSLFGRSNLDIPALFELLAGYQPINPQFIEALPLGRSLDSFIEVQIHGEIDLRRDVEALICDSCYANSPVGKELVALSTAYGFPIYWHPGFKLPVEETPEFFRGYEVRSFAERMAPGGIVDAAILGEAANSFILEPEMWAGWGSQDDITTRFRRLWHAMVIHEGEKGT